MQKKEFVTDRIVKWFAYGMLILTVFVVLVAIFSQETEGEAEIGSFDSRVLSEGWVLEQNGVEEPITLPTSVEADTDEILEIRNTLPDKLSDGSSLLVRASITDIYIYINGELRGCYATEFLSHPTYYIPSAYVVTDLSEEDSGAEVAIRLRIKVQGNLNEVRISNGNNVWFDIIKKNIAVAAVALIVLILGMILVVVAAALHRISPNSKMAICLGFLMIDLGIQRIGDTPAVI